MRILVSIVVDWQPSLEPLYAQLLERYPEGFAEGRFRIFRAKLPLEQRTLKLLEYLRTRNLRPWVTTTRGRLATEFSMRIECAWEPHDLENCELLEICPLVSHEHAERKDGLYCIQTSRWYRHADLSRSDGSSVVVSDRVRRLLDASGLRGFRFAPTAIEDDTDRPIIDLSWDEIGEPWWELVPEHILPPMAPWMPFMDVNGNPVSADHSAAYHVRPALMSTPCHYRRSDLALPPEFDVYGTHERFFRPVEHERVPIVSQRFYRFCVENNLKCGFQPVRLDLDSGPTEPIPPYPPELREFLTPRE